MLEIKDSLAVIRGGGGDIVCAVARHWVQNRGKVVFGDVAQETLV